MYVANEIKYIKLILYYTKNIIYFNAGCTNPGHQVNRGTNFVVEHNTCSSSVWNVFPVTPASMYRIIHAI
jgi:hypothetical protein